MMTSKFQCIALVGILALPTLALAAPEREFPKKISSPIEKVFVPVGFDSNDDGEVILKGRFPTGCYKVGPATATVDREKKVVTVKAESYHYEGAFCLSANIDFIQSVKLGPLPEGQYTVKLDAPGTVAAEKLSVARSTSVNPDDFTYAPVRNVSLRKVEGNTPYELELRGDLPSLGQGCLAIDEVRTNLTEENVLVVQPITKVTSEQQCNGNYEVKLPISAPVREGLLVHVRVLDGQSLNQYFEALPSGPVSSTPPAR